MPDTYRTLNGPARAEIKRDGSRFVARAQPADSREAAEAAIDRIEQAQPDATHHCTAYRVGPSGDVFRSNDDGEPSGTAGPPILRQIDARDLTNTLVVVTRDFGGTKLSTGGLVRAYGDAASAALDAAPIVERVVRVPVRVQFAYDDTSAAERCLHRFDTAVTDRDYTDVTAWTVAVRQSHVEAFVQAFTNALGNRGTARVLRDD